MLYFGTNERWTKIETGGQIAKYLRRIPTITDRNIVE